MIDRLAPLVIPLIVPRTDGSRKEIKRLPVIRPRLAHAPLLCPLAVDRAKQCGYGREADSCKKQNDPLPSQSENHARSSAHRIPLLYSHFQLRFYSHFQLRFYSHFQLRSFQVKLSLLQGNCVHTRRCCRRAMHCVSHFSISN
jgi:hypothetical protein